MVPRRLLVLALLALSLLAGAAFGRAKTDLVFLVNGDRLTGEIKLLDRGILQLKTDGLSTVNIEWDDVDSLNSVYQFRVEDSRAEKYFGAIFLKRGGTMEVISGGVSMTIPADSVVAITPIEASLWSQLDGTISIGYSYTKANSLSQFTGDIWIMRRTSLRQTSFDGSAIFTNSEDSERQLRYDVTVDHKRFFEGILFALVGVGAQRNDELGLDLRTSVGAGMGATIVQTNRSDLVLGLGGSVNREWSANDTQTNNIEGVVTAEHAIFGYDFPKIDYATQLDVFPNLSDWGRVRVELDIRFSREMIKDFFADLSFYDSYDNEPPGGGEKSDYGLVFGLSYKF
jgi:putative salt-induced outer membrane protein YdiY